MLVKATVEGPCTFRKTKGIKKWYGIYRTRTLVEYLDQNFKVEYRRLPHLFVFFPSKRTFRGPKITILQQKSGGKFQVITAFVQR